MRPLRTQPISFKGITARAVAGSYVVLLGMNADPEARKTLLGFSVHRTDHTTDEQGWLPGFRTFKSVYANPPPGALVSSYDHPVQGFVWGDYTAQPGHKYTYRVVARQGKPKNLTEGPSITLEVETEPEDAGLHAVRFNRGVADSQAYAREFGNVAPDKVKGGKALAWLSRGLYEGMVSFIRQASGPGFGLRVAAYEFNYVPVLSELAKAAKAGADVQIVVHGRKKPGSPDSTASESAAAIAQAGLPKGIVTWRKANPQDAISHNKFMVLLQGKGPARKPVQVWTGSTNFTEGGIFGHLNVGHQVRDPALAKDYLDYWMRLHADPATPDLAKANAAATPDPSGKPATGTRRALFSPRPGTKALDWYVERMRSAQGMSCMTAPFGLSDGFDKALREPTDHLRYLILEKEAKDMHDLTMDPDNRIAVGTVFDGAQAGHRWLKEKLSGLNSRVRFIHTKILLIDPLGDDPTVISGSANFSRNSTVNNDENMLVLQGDTRVADVYVGEFLRTFNHYYFRYIASLHQKEAGDQAKEAAYLEETPAWTDRYYVKDSPRARERELFSGVKAVPTPVVVGKPLLAKRRKGGQLPD